jgi:hypothetical protein
MKPNKAPRNKEASLEGGRFCDWRRPTRILAPMAQPIAILTKPRTRPVVEKWYKKLNSLFIVSPSFQESV